MNSQPTLVRRRNAMRGMAAIGAVGLLGGAAGGFVLGDAWPIGPNWVTKSFDYDFNQPSPFVLSYNGPYEPEKPVDDDGIVITKYHGERVYHPVDACWYLFPQLHSFEIDQDPERFDSILKTTIHLLDGAETHRIAETNEDAQEGNLPDQESLWFPYNFEHSPGGLENGLPWYSGMAQGMMLSHLIRMYEVTQDPQWLDQAHLVFNSFRHYRNGRSPNSNPWFVSFIDRGDRRFTTFEEYPSNNPGQISHIVNGNIYSIWGVFDYLRLTEDRYARKILDRSLATLLEGFDDYQASGRPSMYGQTPWSYLTWGNPDNYHRGVTTQLRRTAIITGDETFESQASTLEADIEIFDDPEGTSG